MKNLLALVFLLFIGCTHASTSTRANDPYLKPRLLIGPVEKIYEVAFRAAKKAFPAASNIRKAEGWKVITGGKEEVTILLFLKSFSYLR